MVKVTKRIQLLTPTSKKMSQYLITGWLINTVALAKIRVNFNPPEK